MRVIVALIFLAIASVSVAQKEFSAFNNELGAARSAYLKEKFDHALEVLDRSDKSSSRTAESLDLRGCIYLEQGKFEDAMKAFEAAHAIKYEAFSPRIHLADTLLHQKKFEEARIEYEKLMDYKAPMWPDYARFGVFVTYLGEHDENLARRMLGEIVFPTETPAYYYAQAAWSFAHDKKADAQKWIGAAKKIFDPSKTGWFDRTLYQFGWLKKKPAPSVDPFF